MAPSTTAASEKVSPAEAGPAAASAAWAASGAGRTAARRYRRRGRPARTGRAGRTAAGRVRRGGTGPAGRAVAGTPRCRPGTARRRRSALRCSMGQRVPSGTGPGRARPGWSGPCCAGRAAAGRPRRASSAPPSRPGRNGAEKTRAEASSTPTLTMMASTVEVPERPRPRTASTGRGGVAVGRQQHPAEQVEHDPTPPNSASTAITTRHSIGSVLVARPSAPQTPARSRPCRGGVGRGRCARRTRSAAAARRGLRRRPGGTAGRGPGGGSGGGGGRRWWARRRAAGPAAGDVRRSCSNRGRPDRPRHLRRRP